MDLTQGTKIISRDKRQEYTINITKEVSDRYYGGTKMVYMVDGKWLTEQEINRDFLVAGVDPLPTEHGW